MQTGIADGDNCRDRLRYRENSPRPEGRALGAGLGLLAPPFADRIFPLTEAAALAYGDITSAALRQDRPMTAPEGMIAAIARINGGRLATRNLPDFETTGLELICPWDF
jgi:predicted nucleic acid-binding protein